MGTTNKVHATLRSYKFQLSAITLLGFGLRILFLWRPPLWRDEAFSALVVVRSIPQILNTVKYDSAPPLSYLLTHFIAQLSDSAFALRLLSVVSGTLAIPIAAALAKRCTSKNNALIAALTVAVMPTWVLTARDARMYGLVDMLVLASVLLLWRAIEKPSLSRLGIYTLCIIVAIYTQYFAVLAIGGSLLASAMVFRPSFKTLTAVFLAAGIGAATIIPWLIYAPIQLQHGSSWFWVRPTGWNTSLDLYTQLLGGNAVGDTTEHFVLLKVLQGLSISIGTVAVVAFLFKIRILSASQKRNTLFLFSCSSIALLTLALISIKRPLLEARYEGVLWGPLAILVGVGVSSLPKFWLRFIAIAVFAGTSFALGIATINPDTPSAVAYIQPRIKPGDIVATTADDYLLLQYYGGNVINQQTHILGHYPNWYWGTAAYPSTAVLTKFPREFISGRHTLFTVTPPVLITSPVPVPANYRLAYSQCLSTICFSSYLPN